MRASPGGDGRSVPGSPRPRRAVRAPPGGPRRCQVGRCVRSRGAVRARKRGSPWRRSYAAGVVSAFASGGGRRAAGASRAHRPHSAAAPRARRVQGPAGWRVRWWAPERAARPWERAPRAGAPGRDPPPEERGPARGRRPAGRDRAPVRRRARRARAGRRRLRGGALLDARHIHVQASVAKSSRSSLAACADDASRGCSGESTDFRCELMHRSEPG